MSPSRNDTPRARRAASSAEAFAEALLRDLAAHGDPQRAARERAYLKSERDHLGVPVPTVRARTRAAVRAAPAADRSEVLARAEALWSLGVHEACLAAAEMCSDGQGLFEPRDFDRIERWIHEAGTWALVDVLAPRLVGPLIERSPELDATLARWSGDADPWLRRAALLAYLRPLRRGDEVFGRFARHAESLLEDRSFWVRKALGWCLRERAKRRPDEVIAWLAPRADRASSLTLREARRGLPEADRQRLTVST